MLKERSIRIPDGDLAELVGTGKKIFFLSKREDLDLLPNDVVCVHLSHQRLVNIEFLHGLVARFSSLRMIQVAPHNFERLVGPDIRAIAAEVDVEIVAARFADRACYNRRGVNESYQAKRLFFEQALTDPGKRTLFEVMRVHDFPEIGVVEAYFGPEAASLLQIARGLDRPYQWVQKKVGAFLYWLGMDSNSKAVLGAVHNLEKRLEHALREDGFETDLNSFRTEGRLPPIGLQRKRWALWARIVQTISCKPELVGELERYDIRCAQALDVFYQLGWYADSPKTLEELANRHRTYKERMRLCRNKALDFLGIGG